MSLKNSEKILKETKIKLRLIFLITSIAFVIIFLFFYPRTSETNDESVTYISPLKSTEFNNEYYLGGKKFTLPKQSTVSISNGPDFSVYQIAVNEIDTFGLYIGWYPSIPSEIKKYVSTKMRYQYDTNLIEERKHILNFAKSNGNYSSKLKAEDYYDYELDSLIPPNFDSLLFNLYSDSSKNIWILEPPNQEIGDLDIIVDFGNKNKSRFHLFDNNCNYEQRKIMIDFIKSIQ